MDTLHRLAAANDRIVLTRELIDAGIDAAAQNRLRRDGSLVRLAHGAYLVPPLAEPIDRTVMRAVSRRSGPGAAVSCSAALSLYGCPVPAPVVHVLTDRTRQLRHSLGTKAHTSRIEFTPRDVDGIAAVPPALALIGAWTDERSLPDKRAIVCAALVADVTSLNEVVDEQPVARRVPGAQELLRTCGYVELGCESPPEIDYYLNVELAFRLPAPERQRWFRLPDGRRRRVDICYERERLIIEIDGAQHWLDPLISADDAFHDALFRALGYRVLRFTGADIRNRPEWVAAQVRAELAAHAA